LPNLYLATELERLTELDAATNWRKLTSASLQSAMDAGYALNAITHFLQHYCAGGIPGSFLIRLKLWGNGYSEPPTPHVEAAPLLSLAASTLPDLLADEEIGPLLGASIPAEKRLVRVQPENIARVVELLRERGFDI
jgi:hypothetical protein